MHMLKVNMQVVNTPLMLHLLHQAIILLSMHAHISFVRADLC